MKQIALFDIGIIGGFKMLNVLEMVTCNGLGGNIDSVIPDTVHLIVNLLKIGVPILMVIFGMLDLGKAVMSNDEKEMKGAQTKLIKRILYAVLVFFIIAVAQWIFSVLDKENMKDNPNERSCFNCFLNGECTESSKTKNK